MKKSSSGLAIAALGVCLAACGNEQPRPAVAEREQVEVVAVDDLRAVTMARSVGAFEQHTKREIAEALNRPVSLLLDPTVLTPAQLEVQGAFMDFYCAAEVLQGSAYGYARILPHLCQGFGMAAIFVQVEAGHTYLVDCAVKPGNTTWKFREWGQSSAQTASNTEHPLFAFTADASGWAGFSLTAASEEYFIYRCQITAAG